MSFNVRKTGNSYKINYIGGKGRVTNVNKLPAKDKLQTMDFASFGQPFVNVTSKLQDARGLDFVNFSKPFYANNNGYQINSNTINVSSNHNDVNNWLYRISIFGGSVSQTTINALNIFCSSIDSAGLRNKFYRLNLFCGDNLDACLMPLYVSTSWTSPNYGFLKEINYNFLNSDFVETGTNGGLLGDGLTKYLDTKVTLYELGSLGHVSCYHRGAMNTTSANVLIRGADGTNGIGLDVQSGAGGLIRGFWSPANIASFSTNSGGHYLLSRRSSTDMTLYTNGTTTRGDSINTTPVSFPPSSWSIFVFALNNVGIPSSLCPTRIQGYSMGSAMTALEAASFSTIMQTFQTSLNRN